MAIRTIAQLKAWFRKGLYPTESQFSDWLDSYRHRYDKVAMPEVSGLPEAMNKKYDRSEANELDSRLSGEIRRLRELLPDAAGGSSKVVFFDGFTDFDGELPTMSSSARDGMVLFATRLRRFVYQVQSGSGLSVKTEYFNWWPSAEDYIAEASSGRPRSGCIFILRDSFTPYVASGTSLAELSHSGSGVVLDFYEDDDFSSRAYSHLADGLSKLRVDCSGATTSESAAGEPEEVLFTPDDCIVFDRASTRFVHRRITRGELPGVYPPTVGIVQVEFRNRWIGCEIWGAQGTHGALPADRVYYCSRTNQIYIYHRNYGYATHSFEPVASSVLTGTTLTEEEVRDMVAEIFSQQTPELPAGSILMSADEARQIVDSIFI